MIYVRLRDYWDAHQSMDQTDFRTGPGIDDAFGVLKLFCGKIGKCWKWNATLWFANLGLTITFARVEHDHLFDASLEQRRS